MQALVSYVVCVCLVGGEAAGGVHVLQCSRRRQRHHAVDPHGRTQEHTAGARRGQENGVPQRQDRTGVQ